MKFSFGNNWKKYIDTSFDDEAIKNAEISFKKFIGSINIKGMNFIDFGCGSGIHSLVAFNLGANKIVSIDCDSECIKCCKEIKNKYAKKNNNWSVIKGSLLDSDFIDSLKKGNMVYCWGVAHHTGNMREALETLARIVEKDGYLYIAIYNKLPGKFGSEWWKKIKFFYNKSNFVVKKIMEYYYISFKFILLILHFNNPYRVIKNYHKKRGMSWKTDIIDWLGGYPYEYASAEEIFRFYGKRGFELINLKTNNNIGNNHFLFKKSKKCAEF